MVIWLAMACTFIGAEERQDRRDQDGDGYLAAQWGGEDCDDTEAAVNPDQIEICNGIDDDCDGLVDVLEEGGVARFLDRDGDGYGDAAIQVCEGAAGVAELGNDCDDDDAAVNPGATETCGAPDEDCDGLLNEDDPSLDLSTASEGWPDADGDGFGAEGSIEFSCEQVLVSQSGDCDDSDQEINPDAEEICETDTDENCDGTSDCVLESWVLEGPTLGRRIGSVLDAVDLNGDGLDELILGMPDEDRVGAVWGPAQEVTGIDQSYTGVPSTGMALDSAPSWRYNKPVLLVGSEGEALLMVAKANGASLRIGGKESDFGGAVQLLAGSAPLIAVGVPSAGDGDEVVYLFDGLASGSLDNESDPGFMKMDSKNSGGLYALEGLDHDGDGVEELAASVQLGGPKPETVLVLEPWEEEFKMEDADVVLDNDRDPVAAMSSGDFNGDGRMDLAAGQPDNEWSTGQILVFFGPITSSSLSDADLKVSGESEGQAFGTTLSNLGTPNYTDLLMVGAVSGPVWVLDVDTGSLDLTDALWSDSGEAKSLASGDLNGDGWGDIILGFPTALGGNGEVQVHSGKALLKQ